MLKTLHEIRDNILFAWAKGQSLDVGPSYKKEKERIIKKLKEADSLLLNLLDKYMNSPTGQ